MRKLLCLIVGLLLFATVVHAEDVAWNQDSTAAGGRRQGVLINLPTGENLDVTLSDSAVNIPDGVVVSGTVTSTNAILTSVAAGDTSLNIRGTVTASVSVDSPLAVDVMTMPTTTVTGAVTTSGTVDATLTDSAVNLPDGVVVTGAVTVSGTADVTQTDSAVNIPDGVVVSGAVTTSGTVTNIMADVTLVDTIVEVTLADTAVNYSYELPAKCVAYEFWSDTGVAFTWAFSTAGISSNYMKQQASIPYATFQLGSEKLYTGTLWFNDPTVAGTIIGIHVITKP